jgi:hypothetical protein
MEESKFGGSGPIEEQETYMEEHKQRPAFVDISSPEVESPTPRDTISQRMVPVPPQPAPIAA